jgi:AraC-like DNA-binding protein
MAMALVQAEPPSTVFAETKNLDEFQDVVSGLLRPFALSAGTGPYDARLRHSSVAGLGLTTIEYGDAVEIQTDALERFYLVQIALDGAFYSGSLGEEFEFAGDRAQIINPVAPVTMRWNPSCRMFVLRLHRAMVRDYVDVLSGGAARGAPVFGEAFSLATPAGRRFRRTIEFLLAESGNEASLLRSPMAARQIQQTLFAQLMAASDHDMPFDDTLPRGVPYYVKRADDFIAANVARDISLVDIVASSGVSMRTLYYGYRRCHGVGPMGRLKRLRLDRAKADLETTHPGDGTVTDIAMRWGFPHLGRFASDYRARFGATPSETLRGVR